MSYIHFENKSDTYKGVVIEAKENYFIIFTKGEKIYTYAKDNEYEIGDVLTIKGIKEKFVSEPLESQFNFQEYLNNKGIYNALNSGNIKINFHNPIRIKKLKDIFLSHFSNTQKSVIQGILFSESEDSGTLSNIKKLHLGKLISASGIFINFYLFLFEALLFRIFKKDKFKWLALLILAPYLIFTFPRFTMVRIFFIKLMRIINETFLKKRFRSIQITAFAGLFFLLVDYHLAYQTSFILGFSLPYMIIAIRSATKNFKRIKKRIVELLFFQILFIPFEIQFYNAISPFSMIMQTVLSPFFLLVAISSLLCFYGIPIYGLTGLLIDGLSHLLGWLQYLSFEIYAPKMNGWWMLFYYLLYLIVCYYRNIGLIPVHRFLSITLLSGITLYHLPIMNLITTQVSFINVGQGDACLIRKGTASVLIDVGGLKNIDIAKEVLIPYLKSQRIYNIDMVITTHDDYDHCGAFDSLKENFYVKQKITDATKFPISMNGLTFNNYNNHVSAYNDNNTNSLVVGFTLSKQSYLIMGDAPISIEQSIMNEYNSIPCDILKVGHHGSNSSSSDEFIKYLKPKTAIISCGKNNRYGHPHKRVIQTLKSNNIEILKTYERGTITYRNYIFM